MCVCVTMCALRIPGAPPTRGRRSEPLADPRHQPFSPCLSRAVRAPALTGMSGKARAPDILFGIMTAR